MPREWNYLINPRHLRFHELAWTHPAPSSSIPFDLAPSAGSNPTAFQAVSF
jgi:hypothetical protein